MSAYYIMLSGLSLCGICLCIKNRSRLKDGIFLLISFVVLAGMSAIRYDVGIDYSYIYSPFYDRFLSDPIGYPFFGTHYEPGFVLLSKIIVQFTKNYQVLFIVTSVMIVALVMLYFWFYSPNPFISVFLFVALGDYYCSMDFIRQMIAAAIAMYAFPLLKKRTIPCIAGYFAVILLAASFHKSALILIPFLFINLIPINKYVLAAYAAVTAAIYFNTDRIVEFVTRYWYSSYGINNKHMKAVFTPQFTIAVIVVFLIIFLGSGLLKEIDKRNYLYVNYAFFSAFFVLMGTRHSILDRLSMYFGILVSVGIAVIVHQLAEKLKEENPTEYVKRYANKSAAILMALLVVIFGGGLAIHQYALTMDHHGVVPYKIIWQQPWWNGYVDSLKGDSVNEEATVEPEDLPELLPPSSTPSQDPHLDALVGEQPKEKDGELVEVQIEDFSS